MCQCARERGKSGKNALGARWGTGKANRLSSCIGSGACRWARRAEETEHTAGAQAPFPLR